MAWGISGSLGTEIRKQQSDDLKDQLLQQQMAQRIKEFDEDLKLRREEAAARGEERKSLAEERAADRRTAQNRLGLEEMRMTREQMDEETKRAREAGQERAASNIAGLVPLLQPGSAQARAEVAGQLARINPLKAAELITEPTEEDKAAAALRNLGQQREIIESTAAKFRPPPGGAPDYEWVTRSGTPMQIRKGTTQPGDVPYTPPARTRTDMTPGQAFNATVQLRNSFVRETAAARTVQQQVGLMDESMKAFRAGNKAAGAQGVLVTFQKILDPTSVVRESEYARSAAGQSLLSQMSGAVDRILSGGAGVPGDELEKFVALGKRFAQNQADYAKTAQEQIGGIAEDYGLNPAHITREYGEPGTGGTTPATGGMPTYQDYLKRKKGGQ